MKLKILTLIFLISAISISYSDSGTNSTTATGTVIVNVKHRPIDIVTVDHNIFEFDIYPDETTDELEFKWSYTGSAGQYHLIEGAWTSWSSNMLECIDNSASLGFWINGVKNINGGEINENELHYVNYRFRIYCKHDTPEGSYESVFTLTLNY